ncbi:MAG: hypothetical protein KatS3mg005_4150 [Bryobacteraceae bacterium]|nr:MAG: hypothetical protein KatS3mg005_4150 [Bryobacteraceae bacterium]
MKRTALTNIAYQRSNPAPVRALLYGSTFGIAAYAEGRLNQQFAITEKGRMRAGTLFDYQFKRSNPAPIRALLYGTTFGIGAFTEGRLALARGIQELPLRRRPAVMTCLPGRIAS